MQKQLLTLMILFSFCCYGRIFKALDNLAAAAVPFVEDRLGQRGKGISFGTMPRARLAKRPELAPAVLAEQRGRYPLSRPNLPERPIQAASAKQPDGDSLDYWCQGDNIVKLDPKDAEKLIKAHPDKKQAAIKLTEQTQRVNKLDEMHPDTVGTILWHNWDQKCIDWAYERYDIDCGLTRIKKITKKK